MKGYLGEDLERQATAWCYGNLGFCLAIEYDWDEETRNASPLYCVLLEKESHFIK